MKLDKIPKLTRLEWKTIRWCFHHCGRLDQCGMTEKQVKRFQKKLNLDQVEAEWKLQRDPK